MRKMIKALALASVLAMPAYAQKYNVKKDVITLDKVEVGRITGEIKWAKLDFTVTGANDQKILSVKDRKFDVSNPFLESVLWFSVKFEDSGKTMQIPYLGGCGGECVLKALGRMGLVLDGSPVKNQDDMIAKNNIADQVGKDTLAILEKHNLWTRLLDNNMIIRDNEKPLEVYKDKETVDMNVTTTFYNMVQDKKLIGRIMKTRTAKSDGSVTARYSFFETLQQAEGALSEVPAAIVTDTFINITLVTVSDGKKHSIKFDDTANAENTLANYLVTNGYF